MSVLLFKMYIYYTELALGNFIYLFESSQTVHTIYSSLEYEQREDKFMVELHQL